MRAILVIGIILITIGCNNNTATPGPKTNDTTTNNDTVPEQKRPVIVNTGDTVLKAVGTEPFWALTIIGNKIIEFRSANDSLPVTVPYAEAELMKDGHSVKYESAIRKDRIVVEVTHKNCSDGMSDFNYPLAVVVIVNGTTYKGCGENNKEKKTVSPGL